MGKAGTVYIDVEPDVKKFQTELAAAAKKGGTEAGKTAGKAMSDSLGTNSKAFGEVTHAVAKARVAIGLFGFAVVPVALAVKDAANSASALNEQVAGAGQTFGTAVGPVREFSRSTAEAFGVAASESLRAANAYGAFFKQAGFAQQTSALFSKTLVQLAGDLASFKDVPVTQALDAISSGLAGESEPLRHLGVDLRQTKVDALAVASGFAKTTAELSETDRVAARFLALLQQTSDAQTDAARTAAGYANTQRRAAATLEDFKATAGQEAIPVLTDLTEGFTRLLGTISSGNLDRFRDAGISIGGALKAIGKGVLEGGPAFGATVAIKELGAAGDDTGSRLDKAKAVYQEAFAKFGSGSTQAKDAAAAFRAEVDKAEQSNRSYTEGLETAAEAATRYRTEQSKAIQSVQGFVSAERQDADAHKAVTDATQALSDAEDRLAALRAAGPVDAQKVADAERAVEQATRSVTAARENLADIETEINKLRAGPSADEAGDAARSVRHADLDLQRAKDRLTEAQKLFKQAAKGHQKDLAGQDLTDAELGVADAVDRQNGARKEQADLLNRGKDGSAEMTAAKKREKDAQQAVADAVVAEKKASDDLRTAQAGDPDFAKNLAAAQREVADAQERQKRVQEDLPGLIAASRIAMQQFAADLNAATADGEALRNVLIGLGFGYLLPPASGPLVPNSPYGNNAPIGPPSAPGPIAGDDNRHDPGAAKIYPAPTSTFTPQLGPGGVHISVNAPIDSNTATQIEMGARVADWRIGRRGVA